eukprot:2443116-Rhodomonas_salina.2
MLNVEDRVSCSIMIVMHQTLTERAVLFHQDVEGYDSSRGAGASLFRTTTAAGPSRVGDLEKQDKASKLIRSSGVFFFSKPGAREDESLCAADRDRARATAAEAEREAQGQRGWSGELSLRLAFPSCCQRLQFHHDARV